MKRLAAVFLFSFLAFASYALASYTFRAGSCNAGEVCVLSAWNLSNSHVGECGYFSNYSICASNEVNTITVRNGLCTASEEAMLSIFQQNDSHVAAGKYYDNNVCVSPRNYTCAFKASCSGGQTCLASAYSTANTHVAQCDIYSNQICCGTDTTAPTISGAAVNPAKILPGQSVNFTVTATDDYTVDTVIATVAYPNGTSMNYTMQPIAGNAYSFNFTDTGSNGAHTWTAVYANDTVNNAATSFPNLQFTVLGITYGINGKALDAMTGTVIQSGTATAIIQETGDNGSVTFTGGLYSISLNTSLLANQTRFHVGITVTGEGKTGFNELIVGNGPFIAQTQTCTVKQWHFTGTALDQSGQQISQGTISVSAGGKTGNSTTFTGGAWDIYYSPCLISGKMYTFQFGITGDGKTGAYSAQYVAK